MNMAPITLDNTAVRLDTGSRRASLQAATQHQHRDLDELVADLDLSTLEAIRRREKIGITRSMADAFNIVQDRISRSRLAGDPPDLSLHPKVRDIGLSEFYRAAEAINHGYEETMRRLPEIERVTEGYVQN